MARPGFENFEVQIQTRDLQNPQSPRMGGGCFTYLATPTGFETRIASGLFLEHQYRPRRTIWGAKIWGTKEPAHHGRIRLWHWDDPTHYFAHALTRSS